METEAVTWIRYWTTLQKSSFNDHYKGLSKEKSNPVRITFQKREKSRFDELKWFMCRDQNTKLWLFYTYILFLQTALRKISLKGQCHKISELINFFESVFSGPKLFFNTTGDKYSTTLVTNAQLRRWQMINYAGDKCSTIVVTNAQLHWWQMLNHSWQILNYTGDKCSNTLVKKLFVGVIFKRILCLPVAQRVSMNLITPVSRVFLYTCICHVACKYISINWYLRVYPSKQD